jgi:hypothetical protein
MKTVNYSFASNFVDFALSSVTCQVQKLDGWLGTRAGFWKNLDLDLGLEPGTYGLTESRAPKKPL